MAEIAAAEPATTRLPRRWGRVFSLEFVILGVAVLLVGYLAVVPLLYLLWGTFFDASGPTLRFFDEAYSEIGLANMIGTSLVFAFGSTAISVIVGTLLAYLNVRTDVPFRIVFFAAALVPLIIPGILYTISWIFLLSPRIGLLNRIVEPLLGPRAADIFSLPGMILVEGLHLSPIVFLLMVAAFRSMDPSLEESALMSGARIPTMFRRITLPLVRPALLSALLVMAVRSLESFEVPALLGIPNGIWVFTSRIWRALDSFPPGFGVAGAYAFSLLAITSIGVFLHSRLGNRGRRFQTVTGKGFRPRRLELGRARWPAAAVVLVYFILAVVLPLGILIYASTQRFYSVPSPESIGRATLDNYGYILGLGQAQRALWNSLVLGIGSATAVMLIMAVIAWIVVRTRVSGRWILDSLASLPLAVPGLVMGVSLLFVYLRFPLPIYGTLLILFIAYLTRYMPYGIRYASTSMYQIAAELEESAQTSGASWWQSFRRIVLPLLMPGLLAGWIYIVMVSFRELSSSILLYTPGNEVLSIVIWEQWENGQFTQLAALGVIMVAILLTLVVVAYKLGARIGLRSA
jgi:iron(III) transport system permease protein